MGIEPTPERNSGSAGKRLSLLSYVSGYLKVPKFLVLIKTDRLDTATCTHTLLSTDVHIGTDHVRYTFRYLHCFSVVSCPHPSGSALNGILLSTIVSRAVASWSKASCLGLALRNARWFES
ncbi:hypothetical protein ANN_09246 [Periplaneta americana]|uniref:Uncharacterized protein n=1 Tax=Periplaneta americana TaxID=6978 RepID=A0ABQ8TNC0_PERAM|nr:hypothetical protein ANN_09246 [Periplaneta americana]